MFPILLFISYHYCETYITMKRVYNIIMSTCSISMGHEQARPLCTKAMEDGIFEGLVDPRLQGNYDERQMSCMVACAAFSVRYSAKKRPKMSQVILIMVYYLLYYISSSLFNLSYDG